MSGKQIILLVVLGVAVLLGTSAFYIVDETERVVLLRLGQIRSTDGQPGLHMKIPLAESVRRFDDRILTLDEKIDRVLTSENKNLKVDFFVKWRIEDTAQFFVSTQGRETRALSLLSEIVGNDLLAEFSERTIRQAVADERDEIMAAVKVKSNQKAQDLGIQVVDVRIKRIDLPDDVSESVYDRMRSEREEVIKALRSQGEATAREIRTDADRQREIMVSEAFNRAETIKGEGDARSAAIYAEAYQQDAEFYSFYRSLEAYRSVWEDSGDLMVLEPDGEFFQYFNPSAQP
ncbi:MAG: HflC protein [Salinisphaeraceae bacterium]|jgi:membrane protease subunit HflC|nr:HflC protein [Salinisphaeraceae bacterium]